MLLVKKNILFHLLKVNLIIEANDVFGFPSLLINHTQSINMGDIFLAGEEQGIFVDDVIKCDMLQLTDFGNRVDGAHH